VPDVIPLAVDEKTIWSFTDRLGDVLKVRVLLPLIVVTVTPVPPEV
jgi:hypothetical protein